MTCWKSFVGGPVSKILVCTCFIPAYACLNLFSNQCVFCFKEVMYNKCCLTNYAYVCKDRYIYYMPEQAMPDIPN